MSVLGVNWDKSGVRLSCRPDPARPPRLLDELCALQVPASVAVGKAVRPAGVISALELLDACFPSTKESSVTPSDWLAEAVAAWFQELLSTIEGDIDVQVLLLGGVEQLVIVAPPHARPPEMETLRGMASRTGLPVTVVAHHAACLAAQLGRFEAMRPFFVCDWSDDLVCRTLLAHDTFCHLSQTGETKRRKELGQGALQRLIVKALLAKLDASPDEKTFAQVNTRASLCVQRILAGEELELHAAPEESSTLETSPTPVAKLLPDKPSSEVEAERDETLRDAVRVGSLTLSECEISAALMPALTPARNFVMAAAREAHRNGVRVAVLSGRMFRSAFLKGIVQEALRVGGIESIPDSADEAALMGVHYCVRARPLLPYDCGFLLKRPEAPLGIGTLVLVRPSAIGEERQSEVLELPLPAASALEISFYTRRLDEAAETVIYDVMRNHVFAPTRNIAGDARIRVSMRVEQGEENLATISVDIHDLNNNEHIRFDRLPLIGESEMDEPPLRDARQLPALDWTEKIQQARESSRSPSTIEEWRQAMENRSPRVLRAVYASHILNAVRDAIRVLAEIFDKQFEDLATGLKTWLLMDESVENRDPDDFQAEGRRLLFEVMHRTASLVAENNGRHCRTWLRSYPATDTVSADESCAERLLNSVSQDRAGMDDDSELMSTTTQLHKVFHLTCSPPYSLNITW